MEAMKLMNEIESDFDGEIAEIYVENGQPVEYGQKLFPYPISTFRSKSENKKNYCFRRIENEAS